MGDPTTYGLVDFSNQGGAIIRFEERHKTIMPCEQGGVIAILVDIDFIVKALLNPKHSCRLGLYYSLWSLLPTDSEQPRRGGRMGQIYLEHSSMLSKLNKMC